MQRKKKDRMRSKRSASERSQPSTPAATPGTSPEKGGLPEASVQRIDVPDTFTDVPVGGDDEHSAVAGNTALTPSFSDSAAPRRALMFGGVSVAKTSGEGAHSACDSGGGPAGLCQTHFEFLMLCGGVALIPLPLPYSCRGSPDYAAARP